MYCTKCGQEIMLGGQKNCPYCGAEIANPEGSTGYEMANKPMKWYKFLIYFALFAGALINLSSAGIMFKLAQSGFMPSGLKTVYIIYGVIFIGFAVWGIVCRQKLAKFEAHGPAYLIGLYTTNLVVSILFDIIIGAIAGTGIISPATLISVGIQGAIISANKTYFAKRSHLFRNY